MYSPPARGLLIHCWCPIADAGAGVECGWKRGGWPGVMTYARIISKKYDSMLPIDYVRTGPPPPPTRSHYPVCYTNPLRRANLGQPPALKTPSAAIARTQLKASCQKSRAASSKIHIWAGAGAGAGGWGPLFDTPSYSTSKMDASRPPKSINSLSKTTDFEVIQGGSDPTPYHPSTDLGAGEE